MEVAWDLLQGLVMEEA